MPIARSLKQVWLLRPPTQTGFTLLETLIVALMVGVLGAIAAPAWTQFWATQQVTAARNDLRLALQLTQAKAIAQRQDWRLSLREKDGQVQWAIHPQTVALADVGSWSTFDPTIQIDAANTFTDSGAGVTAIAFNFRGEAKARSIITLTSQNASGLRRCVYVTTLLGRIQNGSGRPERSFWGSSCY